MPIFAKRAGVALILDGTLYNRRELQDELGELLGSPDNDDAEIILAGYQRWGEDVLRRLRGAFALLIWDSSREFSYACAIRSEAIRCSTPKAVRNC